MNELEELLSYCYLHASDSANPIQDLVDKGLADPSYQSQDCRTINITAHDLDSELVILMKKWFAEGGTLNLD
ncbi:MAG TPA: hypothetical protein VJ225_00310 [Nitrososphaeraceae archaeon]|nr:hypothetical protein [Nitrososphaeraceae archaeon]